MAPYFIIFAILALLAFTDVINVRKDQRAWLLLIVGVILTLFAGLRMDVPDWKSYKLGFEEVAAVGYDYSKFEDSSFFEPLYNGVVYLVTLFTNNATIMFTVIAAIAVTLNLKFYAKYSNYFLVAVLLYFAHTFLMRETMQIRAGVAAAIALWALPYALDRKFWKFTLITIIAIGFHMASATIFVLYIVYGLNWSRRTWAWILSVCFVVGNLFPFGRMLSTVPSGGLFDRLLVYSWMVEGDTSAGVLTNPTIIKQLFFCIIGLVYWDSLKDKFPHFKLLFYPLLASVCWLMVWNDFAIVAGRMGTFLSITEVLVAPLLFYLVKPNSRLIIFFLIIIYAFAVLALNLIVENVHPYSSIL